MALQKQGGFSDIKMANKLGTSPSHIRNILNVMEKTQLIFSIKPYSSAGKIVRKPWKYYFLSTSIIAAINYKLGHYDPKKRSLLGRLAENMVASTFYRLKETERLITGIFYPPEKGGVDFLVLCGEKIIPVEVGIGKKNKKQIKKAIKRYKSEQGIIISNTTSYISKEDNILYIPLNTFSLL